MAKCDCYHQHGMKFLCYGTKEMEECSCGGDTSKCDFYPEKRKPKVQTMATEKRLIDANALQKRMFSYYECVNEHTSKSTYTGETLMDYEVADMIEDCIENAPTVDAVEVVRCKDCKHYMTIHCICDGCCISDYWYCADGERKDNEI